MSAPFTHDGSKPLEHANHEDFAQAVVRHNNQSMAYREVFTVKPETPPRLVWEEASRLARRMDVSVRIDWLRAQSLERSQISVVALMRDLYDIATADATELTRMVVTNCRHCHGVNFGYQWVDETEFVAECERIEALNAAAGEKGPQHVLPSCDGGFGFDTHGAPNARCPHCMGVGIRTTWVNDTTALSDKARKLFKGVKTKSDGSIEILMHDQLAARDQLHKLAGAYKTNSDGQSLAPPAPTTAPSGDASVTYLAMVHGGRKAAG
jgi:phage terminase small subunit